MNALVRKSGVARPVLRWHGGKWRLASRILPYFPRHRIYVEPYCGAASLLLRKEPAYVEVINDRDDQVVGLFRVLRRPKDAARLVSLLRMTPFSRVEFQAAYEPSDDPVEAARRLIVRSYMGIGSGGVFGRSTGFRANSNASGRHNTAAEWAGYPDALLRVIERLAGVVIENRDALDCMRAADGDNTLHYVDPPYLRETRSAKAYGDGRLYHAYRHELDGGASGPARHAARSARHGHPVGLCLRSLRHDPDRLASRRTARPRGWRSGAHRNSLDQPPGLGQAHE